MDGFTRSHSLYLENFGETLGSGIISPVVSPSVLAWRLQTVFV